MAYRPSITHERYALRLKTLQAFFAGDLSTESATERIASISLSAPKLEQGLAISWELILISARENEQHQDKLIELLVYLSGLPPVNDDRGRQLKLHDMRVWADLPVLGWEFNKEWNSGVLPPTTFDLTEQPPPVMLMSHKILEYHQKAGEDVRMSLRSLSMSTRSQLAWPRNRFPSCHYPCSRSGRCDPRLKPQSHNCRLFLLSTYFYQRQLLGSR